MTHLSTCLKVGAVLGILAGTASIAAGLWIPVKAVVAQTLLDRAWHLAKQEYRTDIRPWHWADMTIAGRLSMRGRHFVVLDGGTGQALAFAPSIVPNVAQPLDGSLRVVGAHRDTHFKSLGLIAPGEKISYEETSGKRIDYNVIGAAITAPTFDMPLTEGADTLLLVTCWPLDATTAQATERLVIYATRTTPSKQSTQSRVTASSP